jgi:GT2 family glycosyltransferase
VTEDRLVLAVIVPHYNDPIRLGTCLAALAPQLAGRPDIECVVVDNDSPCDLNPLKTAYPGIRFITELQKGAAAARNRGVSETSAPALLFLDSDCVPAPDWLVTALGLCGRAEVIGGRVDTFDETPPPRTGPEAFETVFAFHQKDYIQRKGFSVTANLLTSRAIFEDVGPLRVGLSEDIDWCWRARAKGHRLIYADELAVSHPTRSDWPGMMKKLRRTTDELFFLNGTSPSARMKWLARSLAVLLSGPAQIATVLASPRLSGLGERSRGAGALLRLRAMRSFWMMRQAVRGR